jgi:hypothetical protein
MIKFFFPLIILFTWTIKCDDGGMAQVEMLKEYFHDLENPINPESESILLANIYKAVENLSQLPDKTIYFSILLPFVLSLEEDVDDTRFTCLFLNAYYCAREEINANLREELLGECLRFPDEISVSRRINSIATALDQLNLYKSDFILPGDEGIIFDYVVMKLNRQLYMSP